MTDLTALAHLVRSRRTSLVVDPEREVPRELVDELIELVAWAPNHKRTWPWRVAVCTGDGRLKLGEAFAADMVAMGKASDDPKVLKTAGKYRRSPVVLALGVGVDTSAERAREDRDTVAAGIQNLLLGATAAGLASFWSSPASSDAPNARAVCGFPDDTAMVAVIYLGWPSGEVAVPERPRVPVTEVS